MTLSDRATRLLRLLEPERAHKAALRLARAAPFRAPAVASDPRLALSLMGLAFPNPLGLAAGLDKNAVAPDAFLGLGFGFVEVGTVTPLPQAGNPSPRLFRLPEDAALINRLGFNNEGHEAVVARLDARAARAGIVGVNIGANRDSEDRIFDYVAGVRLFAPVASYLTVNVSSPNTPGLRALQDPGALTALLSRIEEARAESRLESGRRPPLLLKVAPDLDEPALAGIIRIAREQSVDGIIIANTTVKRPGLKSLHRDEAGGLSGRPLFDPSTAMLARARELAGRDFVLVGAGGVDSAATAWSKLAAGADLVQLYTGLIYQGPSLPRRILAGLLRRMEERQFRSIADVRGIETARWASLWPR
jgi:dihydroorotate dehydrogenase